MVVRQSRRGGQSTQHLGGALALGICRAAVKRIGTAGEGFGLTWRKFRRLCAINRARTDKQNLLTELEAGKLMVRRVPSTMVSNIA